MWWVRFGPPHDRSTSSQRGPNGLLGLKITYLEPVKYFGLAAEIETMWFRSNRPEQNRRSERGATLVGYALTLATMVVVALGSLTVLQDNSETFLVGTGNDIGTARLSAAEAANATQAIYAGGNSAGNGSYSGSPTNPIITNTGPTGPSNTFSSTASSQEIGELFLENAAGVQFCSQLSSPASVVLQQCPTSGPVAQQFERLLDGSPQFTYISAGAGLCVARDGNGDIASLDAVVVKPCDNTDEFQQWDDAGSDQFQDPKNTGRCLHVEGGIANGNELGTRVCDNSDLQDFDFGATPPAPPTFYTPYVAKPHTSTDNSTGGWRTGLSNTGDVNLTADGPGTYEILLTGVNAPNSGANSFWVSVNGATPVRWGIDYPISNATIQRATDLNGNTIVPLTVVTTGPLEIITVVVYDREDGTSMGGVEIRPVP